MYLPCLEAATCEMRLGLANGGGVAEWLEFRKKIPVWSVVLFHSLPVKPLYTKNSL